ncbi:hypothetical protein TNCV_2025891 [Trichonephila clavipes]|nr:hypothetical protein TNCV_2025891 [Trichonephila clavipes]
MYLSGDHPICAKVIARKVGIIGEHSETRDELAERLHISIEEVEPGSVQAVIIYGEELEALKDEELSELLSRYEEVVFSKIIPLQKLRIVKICQQLNHSVAITGRKFEDHPCLKKADIGIAMGNSSCDLCCENADMVLLDKSLLTFVTAIREGHNVTVNGDRYRAMITNFFIPELNNHDVQELWFQQDGATCHTARATIDLLKDTFGDRLISRFGPVNWPPRSCDLTLLDYFLWGYVKSLVYADKPQTLDHLEDHIRRVIADIRPEMLEKVIENWTSRLDYIRASRGSPMPEIIFKM